MALAMAVQQTPLALAVSVPVHVVTAPHRPVQPCDPVRARDFSAEAGVPLVLHRKCEVPGFDVGRFGMVLVMLGPATCAAARGGERQRRGRVERKGVGVVGGDVSDALQLLGEATEVGRTGGACGWSWRGIRRRRAGERIWSACSCGSAWGRYRALGRRERGRRGPSAWRPRCWVRGA